jgi:hypothetical protein
VVVRDDMPGTLDFLMAEWMNRVDVRAALHVEVGGCSLEPTYASTE